MILSKKILLDELCLWISLNGNNRDKKDQRFGQAMYNQYSLDHTVGRYFYEENVYRSFIELSVLL